MPLCAKHAEFFGLQSVVIVTVDTYIAVYSIYFQQFFEVELFVKIGNGKDKRLLKIANFSSELGKDLCDVLPALHCFTGNDYASACYGIGKTTAFKAIKRNEDFINSFKSFGDTFLFKSELFPMVKKFVCKLYVVKTKNVNERRYLNFYGKKKIPEIHQLPPTANALCHCKRVSYATTIIKQLLVSNPVIPSLAKEFGWSIENGSLKIQWTLLPPAPDKVLNLINCSCSCKKGCKMNACTCKLNDLQCIELCQCTDEYENGKSMEEEIEEQDVEDDPYLTDTDVHSAVFTGHLVYACVVVALIFCNNNSLIMMRELTSIT